jgi:hypothetical protein
MKDEVTDRRWVGLSLVLAVVGLCVTLLGTVRAGGEQGMPAGDAVRGAADRLAQDGYVAQFRWSGTNPVSGEVRYSSPLAYGMRVVDEGSGATLEYLLLDPDLYSREIPPDAEMPVRWLRRAWHPDAPIAGLTGYPPGLPLELLRSARETADAGIETVDGRRLYRIDGVTSYFAALIASYNDVPAPTERQQMLAATLVPLRVWLDETRGDLARMEMTIPMDAAALPPGTLTYDFSDAGPAPDLEPPEDARMVESDLLLRPGPTVPVESLPITLTGSGRLIAPPPFVTHGGIFRVTLTPTITDLQYQLWRIKRGRQLIAGLGTIVGPGGTVTIPFVLQPGEYVFEVQLPEPADWTVEIEEVQ